MFPRHWCGNSLYPITLPNKPLRQSMVETFVSRKRKFTYLVETHWCFVSFFFLLHSGKCPLPLLQNDLIILPQERTWAAKPHWWLVEVSGPCLGRASQADLGKGLLPLGAWCCMLGKSEATHTEILWQAWINFIGWQKYPTTWLCSSPWNAQRNKKDLFYAI